MAYEFTKEIAEAGVNNVVPSYAPFSEAFFYLQEATESNWNELMYDIGIRELGVLESTGMEVVYEEGSEASQSLKDKIVAFVQDAWKNVKGLVQNLLTSLEESMNNAKEKFTGAVLKNIKKKVVELDRLNGADGNKAVVFYKNYIVYDQAALDNLGKAVAYDQADHKTEIKMEDLIKDRIESFTKQDVVKYLDDIVKYALDFKFTKKSILGGYNSVKKSYDNCLKSAKKSAVADEGNINDIKAKITVLNKNSSVFVKAVRDRQKENLAVLSKIVVKTMGKGEKEKAEAEANKAAKKAEKEAKKNAKTEEVKESVAPVTESYTSEIERMFDWNF